MASLPIFGVYFVSLISSADLIAEAATFSPNCTLPPSDATFVASPNTRGTLSILWSCLSVIILCTWNIQHLNIPSRRPYFDSSGQRVGFMRRGWWAIMDVRTTFKWMLFTVLVPEYNVGRALSERLAATSSLGALRSRFGDEMEIVHAYIMNMGGYYLDFSDLGFFGVDIANIRGSDSSGLSSTAVDYSGLHFSKIQARNVSYPKMAPYSSDQDTSLRTLVSKPTRATSSHDRASRSNLANEDKTCSEIEPCPREVSVSGTKTRQKLQFDCSQTKHQTVSKISVQHPSTVHMSSFQILNLSRFKYEKWALTALQLLSAKGFKLYDSLPPVSPQELESLGNSDSIVKLLAIVQIGWLMIQLLVRYQNNLPSSQLEVAALAFAVCSLLTYVILWDRPRGVTVRYRVAATKIPNSDEVLALATFGPGYLWTWNRPKEREDDNLHLLPIPNDAGHAMDVRNLLGGFEDTIAGKTLIGWLHHNHPAIVSVIAGSVLGGTLFGGMHCLGWNFTFPTHTEKVLWRTCSIATTVLPLLSTYFNLQWSYYNGWVDPLEEEVTSRFHGPILLVCFVLPYVLARLFLLVETFRSLFFLPPETFIDTWPGAFLLWG